MGKIDMNSNFSEKKYNELLEEIYIKFPSFQKVGGRAIKYGLDNMLFLDKNFNFPSQCFGSVHIAGTNGKGSVSSMIASALMSMGLRVGLYTSPHLIDFRERIKINGKMVPKRWVFKFLLENRNLFEKVGASFFEITTMMAFCYFAQKEVDIAVIECGLGGRLDSTNIIEPMVSVITNIGLDHCEYLGKTLNEIAIEKGGIIKKGVPVVVGERLTNEPFESIAKKVGAPIYFAQDFKLLNKRENAKEKGTLKVIEDKERVELLVKDIDKESLKATAHKERVELLVKEIVQKSSKLKMDLIGDYQEKNRLTAATALSVLYNSSSFQRIANKNVTNAIREMGKDDKCKNGVKQKGENQEDKQVHGKQKGGQENKQERYKREDYREEKIGEQIAEGIANAAKKTNLLGRWQTISEKPLIICDIGHNQHGLKVSMPQVKRVYEDILKGATKSLVKDKISFQQRESHKDIIKRNSHDNILIDDQKAIQENTQRTTQDNNQTVSQENTQRATQDNNQTVSQENTQAATPKLYMVFGVMKDKDIAAEIPLLPKDANYLWVNVLSQRAMPAYELSEIMMKGGIKGRIISSKMEEAERNDIEENRAGNIENTLNELLRSCNKRDFIFIGGSSYVVAEALRYFKKVKIL